MRTGKALLSIVAMSCFAQAQAQVNAPEVSRCDATATERLSMSMTVLNAVQPFVSQDFAQKLAAFLIEYRYPKEIFVLREPAHVTDKGGCWAVSFDNALRKRTDTDPMPIVGGKLRPKQVTVTLRKTNAEVVAIQ